MTPEGIQKSAVLFLTQKVLPEFSFPLQRIQTDRAPEFIGEEFQKALREQKIKD